MQTLSFLKHNFCSIARIFKIFAEKREISRFSFQEFGELRVLWGEELIFPTPWDLKFRTMAYILTFTS